MNSDSLQTSFWVMILIQTIGSVDMPGRGKRKMPSPRQYVAILVTWVILQFVSAISDNTQRAAASVGWLLVVAGMVIGPFGSRAVSFLQIIAAQFTNNPATQAAQDLAAQQSGTSVGQVSGLTPSPPAGTTLGG